MITKYYNFKDLPSRIVVATGEHLEVYSILNNDFEGEKAIKIELRGENSSFILKCGCILKGQKKVSLSTETIHEKGNNFARVEIKSLLFDNSFFDFQGIIKIEKNAFKSDSYLKHDSFLYSSSARVNTSPKLEIKANNVKASHGATIKSFNKSDLFYIISRGLTLKKAKKLIAKSFIESIFSNVTEVLKELKIKKLDI